MSQNKKLTLYFFIFFVAAGLVGFFMYQNGQQITDKETAAVHLALSDTPAFTFELADTLDEQVQGLSGRDDVPHNHGMLFVFPKDGRYGFWMKDMLVSIDIIWLSDTGKILSIEDSVSLATYPSVFYPPELVRYVLETRAGEARAQGWSAGSVISLPL